MAGRGRVVRAARGRYFLDDASAGMEAAREEGREGEAQGGEMSRNHDGMTHYVGDDCPGGHAADPAPETPCICVDCDAYGCAGCRACTEYTPQPPAPAQPPSVPSVPSVLSVEEIAQALVSLAYDSAVRMHETIKAGRGAVGWQDADVLRHVAAALRAERTRQDARVARLEEALRLAREGWTCDECHGTGSYATPVHVCGGRSEEECAKRCPEAEETKCERCDVIAAALAGSRSAEEGE